MLRFLALTLVALLVATSAHAENLLRNPGFDRSPVLDSWQTKTYGAVPTIERDTSVFHGGAASVRIAAAAPSDTAFAQDLSLKPSHWYRFSGWVRTRSLHAVTARVTGTLQVQGPGGQPIIASADNHAGDTDWSPVSLFFSVPADGRVHLAVFFAGFGTATGTAWFDDLTLDEVNMAALPITVTSDPISPAPISPFQYGQFIEYLCDLVPGMWAEKLYDGSFEGLSPYDFVFRKETDFREKPWYPSGDVNRAEYSLDPVNPVNGNVSEKITVPPGVPCTVGLSQDGLALQRGQSCRFVCYLRSEGITGPVTVSLEGNGQVLASGKTQPGSTWTRHELDLLPAATTANARFTIDFHGPGTLWLDAASLVPSNAVGGWRPDVVRALQALKPGIIRFGGSAIEYSEWLDTIGDPLHRKPFRAWGGLQPTGPGLEEIVQLIQRVGAEPLICVRFTGRTPQDAADQVEYFNGAGTTKMGHLRAANGRPQPYHIRYWQVGNEVAGAEYDSKLAAFCQAMKQVDPSIRLLSSFPSAASLHSAAPYLDYVCPHQYDIANLAATRHELDSVRDLIRQNAAGRSIHVAVTEWNTTAGDAGLARAKLWTLANALACSRYQNLLHRNSDLVEIANRSNLTNSFCSGIVQTDRSRLYLTPTYYAQQLYATLAGSRPLRVEASGPSDAGPDLSATLSADGKLLTLFAVNDTGAPITRPLDLSAFTGHPHDARVWTLADRDARGEPDATNSFEDPTRISPRRSRWRLSAAQATYSFPAYSLTVIQFKLK